MRKALPYMIMVGAAGTAVFLYALKHDTRQISQDVRQLERQIEASRTEISVLRAELGELTRPERIEELARTKLGLMPQAPHQFAGTIKRQELSQKPRGR